MASKSTKAGRLISKRPRAAPAGFPDHRGRRPDCCKKPLTCCPAEAVLPDGRTPADSATVRVVFIVGPDKQLKLSMTYPMNVGRNFAEVLRALDALQTAARENHRDHLQTGPWARMLWCQCRYRTKTRLPNTGQSTKSYPILRMAKLPS